MKIELKHPITINKAVDKPGIEIKELNLVDVMQVKHADLIPDDCFQGEESRFNPTIFIPLIASMSGIEENEARELAFIDLMHIVGAVVTPFLSGTDLPQEKTQKK